MRCCEKSQARIESVILWKRSSYFWWESDLQVATSCSSDFRFTPSDRSQSMLSLPFIARALFMHIFRQLRGSLRKKCFQKESRLGVKNSSPEDRVEASGNFWCPYFCGTLNEPFKSREGLRFAIWTIFLALLNDQLINFDKWSIYANLGYWPQLS